MKIAVLLTCYNRVEVTSHCIKRLLEQEELDCELKVFLVDDGSDDNSGEIIRERYPEVIVVEGDGNLYWNGGMRLAWESALALGEDFDAFLWLNDDVELFPTSLKHLLDCYKKFNKLMPTIVVGSLCEPLEMNLPRTDSELEELCERCTPTYGGKCYSKVVPVGKLPLSVNDFNGNLVLVPDVVTDLVGVLSKEYTHSFGDIDYGIRARRRGVLLIRAPLIHGFCKSHPQPWADKEKRLSFRLAQFFSPKGLRFKELKHFMKVRGVGNLYISYLKALLRVFHP